MCSLCRLPVTKNRNFGQILTFFRSSSTDPLLPIRVKFGVLEQIQGLHLPAKFHLNVFIVSAPVAKNHNFGQILTLLGAPVPTPFYRRGPNLVSYSRPTVYVYLRNFVSIGLFCRPVAAETPIFAVFGFRHLVVSPFGSSRRKLNTGTQLQTFPYPTASKSFLYSNAFMAKSGAQSLTFQSVTNRQTDKQKNSTFLAASAAGEIRAPPNLAR